jgi:hypothetical protein
MSVYVLRPDDSHIDTSNTLVEMYGNMEDLFIAMVCAGVLWSSVLLYELADTTTKASQVVAKMSHSIVWW